mmetsp:Transcript_6661/g.5778  ORF Transcript_6661/g.5778 Transcript_6661/m.5778 type:complete len:221 (+) Transcript_6661:984-1646(+)
MVDTICGMTIEEFKGEEVAESNSDKDISMEEESKEENGGLDKKDDQKDQKEKEADDNESKVLEQMNNKKKTALKGQDTIFNYDEGVEFIINISLKYFNNFVEFLRIKASERIDARIVGHRRTLSMGASGGNTFIPVKYKNEPIVRILIARTFSFLNTLMSFQSSEFSSMLKDSSILEHIVELCQIYDDHSLIQAEFRSIFHTILKTEDISIIKKFLKDGK